MEWEGHGDEAHSPVVAVVALVVVVLASDRLFATFPPCPVQKRNHLVTTKCTLFTSPQPNCHHLHLLAILAGLTDISKTTMSCRWKPGNPGNFRAPTGALKPTIAKHHIRLTWYLRVRGVQIMALPSLEHVTILSCADQEFLKWWSSLLMSPTHGRDGAAHPLQRSKNATPLSSQAPSSQTASWR